MDERFILIDKEFKNANECSFGMPWEHDSICYNFKYPNEFVLASEAAGLANDKSIVCIIIGCDLEDYSFLKGLSELRQLYIYNAKSLSNLTFLDKQFSLRQLYISDSKLKNLNALAAFLKRKEKAIKELKGIDRILKLTEGICINSDFKLDCAELDSNEFYVSELIINGKHVRR